jgi:hypothetical protein
MKISDLLHKVADSIPPEADTEVDINDAGETAITDAMVPPLQQELELKKKEKGINNAFDNGQIHEDELAVLRRLTGL